VVEARLGGSDSHLKRLSRQVRLLALRAGRSDSEAVMLSQAAMLRDLGNIKLPDSILMKPGPLTVQEWETVRTHTILGHDLLATSLLEDLRIGATVALEHHERWNGGGYPNGKRGHEINFAARLTSIIDVYDRMISDRPYRKALPLAETLAYLRSRAGEDFDPDLMNSFFEIFDEINATMTELDVATVL
jgi:putative two-component system response regulator